MKGRGMRICTYRGINAGLIEQDNTGVHAILHSFKETN